jgi:alanyl-tRNA synthetase
MPDAPCERLYRADPFLTRFRARVTRLQTAEEGSAFIELDRSAFYPTGGGQPFDTGRLGGLLVVDVQDAGDGRILHQVRCEREDLPAAGAEVDCEVDWARRFDHMQQHTGQHILSRACEATRSFHLGERLCTIDIGLADPSAAVLKRAEALCNETIGSNVPVTVSLRPADDAPRIAQEAGTSRDLALKPGDPVRLVAVGAFDETPCGGTHVAASGQVGGVFVRTWERFKGGTRVTFVCGGRIVAEAARLAEVVDRCSARLSAPAEAMEEAVARIQEQVAAARRRLNTMSGNLATLESQALERTARETGGWRVIQSVVEQRGAEDLQRLAQACTAAPGRMALLAAASGDGSAVLIFARSAEGPCPAPRMGELLSGACAAFGGRGGGGATLARGGGISAAVAGQALEVAWGLLREKTGP